MTLTLACTRYFFIETLVCMDSENHVTVSLATHAIPHIFWELGIGNLFVMNRLYLFRLELEFVINTFFVSYN